MPLTKQEFLDACAYLTSTGALVGIGALFIDGNAQTVLDEGDSNADITPLEATLTQALIDLAAQQSNEANAAIVDNNSETQASSIPNWATWDEATALAWFDTNIGNNLPVANLTEANAVLDDMATLQRNLIRLVVALRNKSFPNLQE